MMFIGTDYIQQQLWNLRSFIIILIDISKLASDLVDPLSKEPC